MKITCEPLSCQQWEGQCGSFLELLHLSPSQPSALARWNVSSSPSHPRATPGDLGHSSSPLSFLDMSVVTQTGVLVPKLPPGVGTGPLSSWSCSPSTYQSQGLLSTTGSHLSLLKEFRFFQNTRKRWLPNNLCSSALPPTQGDSREGRGENRGNSPQIGTHGSSWIASLHSAVTLVTRGRPEESMGNQRPGDTTVAL